MFDSHAHVAYSTFDPDRDEVIRRARESGVTGWLEIGTDLAQSEAAVALAQQQESVWAAVGVHPSDIGSLQESDWSRLEALVEEEKVVAVGEVGLDFYRGGTAADQLPVLERFVKLAVERNLPVVFHVRDLVKESGNSDGAGDQQSAHDTMITFLQSLPLRDRPRGVMHTFSGNQEQAAVYLELGMYLSFSGVVTFKNARVTAEVATTAPLDKILIETDCPFLAPEPHRGKRNEPAYVKFVAEKIAQLRGLALAEVEQATDNNFRTLFGVT